MLPNDPTCRPGAGQRDSTPTAASFQGYLGLLEASEQSVYLDAAAYSEDSLRSHTPVCVSHRDKPRCQFPGDLIEHGSDGRVEVRHARGQRRISFCLFRQSVRQLEVLHQRPVDAFAPDRGAAEPDETRGARHKVCRPGSQIEGRDGPK